MTVKREQSETDSSQGTPNGGTPKKQRTFKGKRPWTTQEDRRFLDLIDQIVKAGLWSAMKNDPELAARGANGIRSHWDSIFKQMKGGISRG
ncbi:hypothetical protein IAU60_004126 [Kwoniella sp. DSM 27419]